MGMCKGFKLVGKKFSTEESARNAVGLYFIGQKCFVRFHAENPDNGYIIYMIVNPKDSKRSQKWKELPTIRGEFWGLVAANFLSVGTINDRIYRS